MNNTTEKNTAPLIFLDPLTGHTPENGNGNEDEEDEENDEEEESESEEKKEGWEEDEDEDEEEEPIQRLTEGIFDG